MENVVVILERHKKRILLYSGAFVVILGIIIVLTTISVMSYRNSFGYSSSSIAGDISSIFLSSSSMQGASSSAESSSTVSSSPSSSYSELIECNGSVNALVATQMWIKKLKRIEKFSELDAADKDVFKIVRREQRDGYGSRVNTKFIYTETLCNLKPDMCKEEFIREMKVSNITGDNVIIRSACAAISVGAETASHRHGHVFTSKYDLITPYHFGDMKNDNPLEIVRHLERVGNAITVYPDKFPHFLLEEFPIFMHLYQTLPDNVPIATCSDLGYGQKFFNMLYERNIVQQKRVIPFEGYEAIIADEVFSYIALRDLPGGDESTVLPNEEIIYAHLFSPLTSARDAILGSFKNEIEKEPNTIVLIFREVNSRNLTNYYELLAAMRANMTERHNVVEYRSNEMTSLDEIIPLFMNAKIVVGVHGAGLANMIFCRDGSSVLEIAYDRTDGMPWPQTWFMSCAVPLGLNYGVSVGEGDYFGNVECNINDVLEVLNGML